MQCKDSEAQTRHELEATRYDKYVLRKVGRARASTEAGRVWSNDVVAALFRARREQVLSSAE
ncbi:hypothetical protein S7S_16465 [Isoalcanivorax pacificus W11-5]|uniref:Uncharacterized protein n=1 Tax=Isoalcanivorax pacificus W11-5 TaxID=391936 RepID=A0A0B4XSH8_9GAMM|nr:hypothetical protein S7S_16465 [Isoalcanivorax pacificus W11-5]